MLTFGKEFKQNKHDLSDFAAPSPVSIDYKTR